jgi:probable HAF family extracellular repeat protein
MRTLIVAGILGTCTAATVAQTPGFWLMGLAPESTGGVTRGLSQDGMVAVGGTGNATPLYAPGFRWTQVGGRYDFGLEPGMPSATPASAVSSDGNVIVGMSRDGWNTPPVAYRRVGNGPLENLGTLPNHITQPFHEARSYATGVSGDGSVVVGRSEWWWGMQSPDELVDFQAVRWTPQGGIQPLGDSSFWSEATAVSRDGTTIVGSITGGPGFVWRESTGMQALPTLPGSPSHQSTARGINADGAVIVGSATNATGHSRGVRWTSAGVEDLGSLTGTSNHSIAFAVSDDGLIVGGSSGQLATLWTPGTGIIRLEEYLSLFDIIVPSNVNLEYIYAVSGDGLTFAGEARVNGVRQGFVATIPAPSGLLVVFAPALLALRRRRATDGPRPPGTHSGAQGRIYPCVFPPIPVN